MALMMRRMRVDWNRRIRKENNTYEDSDGSHDEEGEGGLEQEDQERKQYL
jgi:hypothetical protein